MASSAVEKIFEDEEDVLEDFFLVLPDEDELLELMLWFFFFNCIPILVPENN